MKTLGKPNFLKAEIEKKYSQKIQKVLEEGKREMTSLKRHSSEKVSDLRDSSQNKVKKEAQIAYDTAFNEVMTSAKRDYELFQEEKNEEIFEAVLKDSEKICSSAAFVEWVSSFVKGLGSGKNIIIKCVPAAKKDLEKATKAKVVADNNVKGAIVEAFGTTYDLTLETLLNTKKDLLRGVIAHVLLK